MTALLLGIGLTALAFLGVAFVQIRGGCAGDCGACDRPCTLGESDDGQDDQAT